MKRKAIRVGIALAATLAVYAVYALAAVPFIEPGLKRPLPPARPPGDAPDGSPTASYRELFRRFFAEDSWVMKNPKLLESDKGILLIKDYDNIDARSIRLAPFAMVMFPSEAARNDPARVGEAIILEAPEAILEFDNALDLSKAKIGNLKGGRLVGEVTIRSDQKLPGPADDLLITTRDITLGETKIETQAPVTFRLGPNVGGGRLLRIHLSEREDGRDRGPMLGSLQGMELVYDVKMHFQMAGEGLLPGKKKDEPTAVTAARVGTDGDDAQGSLLPSLNPTGMIRQQFLPTSDKPQPPVEITSRGPFRFDFIRHEASFERDVDVLRVNPVGESDHLTCDWLAVGFAPRAEPQKPTDAAANKTAPPADEKPNRMPALEVRRLRASGRPVVIRSPSTGASARCEKIEYDLKTGRVTMEDSARVMLRTPRNEISAPKVSYMPGANDGLPTFEAIGSGWLEAASESDPTNRFRAAWKREIRLRPHEGQHLLSVLGEAELNYASIGGLAAEEIWLWMHEKKQASAPAADSRTQARSQSQQQLSGLSSFASRAIPDRLLASGNVKIRATQLTGDPGRFEVWFQDRTTNAAAAENAGLESIDAEPPPNAPERRLPIARVAGANESPSSRFNVAGKLLRVNVLWTDTQPLVEDVEIVGGAELVETALEDPTQKPFSVRGEEVRVARASANNSVATITGKPAVVAARGLVMSAAQINFDRGANRLWIDGPGQMTLPIDRDLDGKPLATPHSLSIDWQTAMDFDGETIRYRDGVEASGPTQRLATQLLQAKLAERIDFAAPPKQPQNAKVAALTCQGGLRLDSYTYDAGEQTAHDVILAQDLAIDQLTGAIVAHGPGSIRSHRRGAGQMFGGSSTATPREAGRISPSSQTDPLAATDSNTATSGKRISFLEAHFEREASGNLNTRQITLSDQIRCVYGPVDDWQQSIVLDVAREVPEGVVTLTSDRLSVAQPVVDRTRPGRQPIELAAEGNAFVEGTTFTARADRMTYAEAKDLMILEGTGRTDAILTRQAKAGGPSTKAAARKVMYWRTTNTVEVDDAKSLNLGNLPPISRDQLR
jgi:lipopolysaccharide export system protein LptA